MVFIVVVMGLLVGVLVTHLAEALMGRRRLARPVCPYCTAPYSPLQWSATLALLAGQRRCRQCQKAFRWPRLAGELLVAVSWGVLVWRYGLSWRMVYSMVALLPLAMIMVTDLEAKRVPNVITLPSIAAMLVLGMFLGPALPNLQAWGWKMSPLGALAAFVALRLLVWLGVAAFGEGALGEGDITLATYVGAIVGFPLVLEALLLAFLLGGVGAAAVLISRRGSLQTAIPYGPYIILGGALTLIFSVEMLGWLLK